MAISFLRFPAPIPNQLHLSRRRRLPATNPRCSTSSPAPPPNPEPLPPTPVVLELRRKAALLREGRGAAVSQPEPPNYEIGWKRTKEIKNEKPKGWAIADVVEKLEGLMGRQYGSAELLAKVGSIVSERAREEADVLLAGGEVDDRMVTELHRVLKLIEMDLEMVKAAVREETLAERIEQARARCRQAIRVALSF
uniref:Chlororespiratory reduction 41 n=1 Tax=Habenaria pantlingiana TaxID=1498489 RepID=A0A0F7J4D3_9ASPA|nr:chlororespiratory reduction 41 [Habenaria pantlingiana]